MNEAQNKHLKSLLLNEYGFSINDIYAWALVKNDIFQISTQESRHCSSLYSFLNQLLMVFQFPVKITVYSSDEPEKYKREYTTSTDPVYKKNFKEKYLDTITTSELKKNLIPIYSTNYYLLVTKITRNLDHSPDQEKPLNYEHYPLKNSCYQIVKATLDANVMEYDPLYQQLKISDYWQDNFKDAFAAHKKEELRNEIPKQNFTEDRIFDIADEIIDKYYDEFASSKLLKADGSCRTPNICYFVRSYDKSYSDPDTTRYGFYNYQIRMVIPAKQKTHFEKAFNTLKKALLHNEGEQWKFDGTFYEHFNDKYFSVPFLSLLNSKEGIKRIIEIMETPYSHFSRCFVDPVLSTGFLDVRRTPFQSLQGLDWIMKGKEDEIEVQNDKIRIVALYYLFCTMLPSRISSTTKKFKMSCLIKPLLAELSPWLCFVHLAEFEDEDENENENENENEDENKEGLLNWQRYHHFVRDISMLQGRRISDEMLTLYYKHVSTIIKEDMSDLLMGEFKTQKVFLEHLNQRFDNTCCIFPYSKISLSIVFTSKSDESNHVAIYGNENRFFKIELIRNPYFAKMIGPSPYNKKLIVREAIQNGLSQIPYSTEFKLKQSIG